MKAIALILLLSLILVLDVKALAVASDYLEDNTLNITEGTSKIYSIRLQNPYDYELKVGVEYGKGLMQAMDFREEYALEPKSSTKIEFNVTAPKYIKGKDLFTLGYTIHQISGLGGEGVGFSPKLSKSFKLRVVRSPDRFYIDPIYIVSALGAAAFLLLVYRKKIINFWKAGNRFPKNRFKSRKIIKWKH